MNFRSKIFSAIIALCLMIAVFGVITVSAAELEEPAVGVNLRITATTVDGEEIMIKDHTDFEDGWNEAVKLATTKSLKEKGYAYVTVTLHNHWVAEDENFGSGDGFAYGAIKIPENTVIRLDLNDHTIDRDLDEYKYNGEVIYVDENADVLICDGTIMGGFSCNGAGGIHITDNGRATLNNVSVSDNKTEDDDGAGIALYNGATLIVNGGYISRNAVYVSKGATVSGFLGFGTTDRYGAGVYVSNATATFNGVEFENNESYIGGKNHEIFGSVISAKKSTVTMTDCDVSNNLDWIDNGDADAQVMYFLDSEVTIKNSSFTENGLPGSRLFHVEKTDLIMAGCDVFNNTAGTIFVLMESTVDIKDTEIKDNAGLVMINYDKKVSGSVSDCSFDNNVAKNNLSSFMIGKNALELKFENCDFGDSSFMDKKYMSINNAEAGSISIAGSISTVIAIVAMIVSLSSITVVYSDRKKRGEGASDEEADAAVED